MKNKKKTGAEKVLFSKQLSRKDQNLLYFIIALKECLKKMPFEKVSVSISLVGWVLVLLNE